jgi:N-acetylmuramoyl-L-alanine amidase
MLVETAFISNSLEEQKLGDPRHQERLAEAIRSGVRSYFYDNPPPGTRIAQLRAMRQASNAAAAPKLDSN